MDEINHPILETFRIKIVVDTQILSYLVDKTYLRLNDFFEELLKCDFVDIVCSKFAIYEFIGVRKLEHYLREIYNKASSEGGTMNFSSALRYRSEWSAPELPYESTYELIKYKVEADLIKISSDFSIDSEKIAIHSELWKPHQELVLSSKLSKEDCLLFLSSIFPDPFLKESHVIFLTNDNQFYKALCGGPTERMSSIDDVLKNHGLHQPSVFRISEIPISSGTKLDLKSSTRLTDISTFTKKFLSEHVAIKAKQFLLGVTIKCEAKPAIAQNLLCFKLLPDAELNKDIYIVVIGADLSFQYVHPVILSDFRCYKNIETFPYKPISGDARSHRIAIKLQDAHGENLKEELISKLQAPGNLVFVHPDSVFAKG